VPLVLQVKVIKPNKLNKAAMRRELLSAMREAAKEIEGDFKKTTRTWKKKPKFVKEMDLSGPGPVVLVGTDNEIYKYVDEGTKPHAIPKRRVRSGYTSGGAARGRIAQRRGPG